LARNKSSRPIETRLSRTFQVRSPDRLEDVLVGQRLGGGLGLEDIVRHPVDLHADALQDVGGAIDDGVE